MRGATLRLHFAEENLRAAKASAQAVYAGTSHAEERRAAKRAVVLAERRVALAASVARRVAVREAYDARRP